MIQLFQFHFIIISFGLNIINNFSVFLNIMEYTITTILNTDIAYFKRSGPIDLHVRKDNRKCILDYCMKFNLNKVIVDARDQESALSIIECFNFGAETAVLMKRLRIAVLHREADESIDYTVNAASSRGMKIRGFLEKSEAIQWLS